MKITAATPVCMIIYYAGLRDEYESAKSQEEKDNIYSEAKEIFESLEEE